VVTLGFLKKKGKQEKRAEPKTRTGSVSCPVASAPRPNVRLKFEKPPLDLSAIRHCGLTYRRSERIGGTVAAFAWRAEPSSIKGRGKNSVNNRCRIAKHFRPKWNRSCAYFIGTSSHCVFSNTIQNLPCSGAIQRTQEKA